MHKPWLWNLALAAATTVAYAAADDAINTPHCMRSIAPAATVPSAPA